MYVKHARDIRAGSTCAIVGLKRYECICAGKYGLSQPLLYEQLQWLLPVSEHTTTDNKQYDSTLYETVLLCCNVVRCCRRTSQYLVCLDVPVLA